MKKILNSFKKIISSSILKNPAPNSEPITDFFKPYSAKNLPPKTDAKEDYVVEEKVPDLQRVILSGLKRTLVQSKISNLVINARFHSLSPSEEELIEKVHYACYNNTPISVQYVKKLVPEIDFKENELLNEDDYNAWLNGTKKGNGSDGSYSYQIGEIKYTIEDPVGVKRGSEKGKTGFTEWKVKEKAGWKRK